ncbi:MAG: GNAT family N-acetyltransferase [Planctomycetota bacterium]
MENRIIPYSEKYYSSLMEFFKKVSPEITPDIWDEKYKNHPDSEYGKISEHILIDKSENVIGHSAWHQIDVLLNNNKYTGAWFLDWFVSPEYKGKGAGKALALETIPENTDLLMVARGTHDTVVRMEKWKFLNPVTSTSYLLPLTARTISRRKRLNVIGKIILHSAWFIVKSHFRKQLVSIPQGMSINPAESVCSKAVSLNGANRTDQAVNYFKSFTNSDIQILNISIDNSVSAQLIINCSKDDFDLERVKILDLIILDDNIDPYALTNALNNIIYDMQKEGIDCIECLSSSDNLSKMLESLHFMKRDKASLYVKPLNDGCEAELKKEGEWNFSFFDSDMFYR